MKRFIAGEDRQQITLLPDCLDDYASTEKISVLPEPLSTQGAPAGFTPSAGDIAFYVLFDSLSEDESDV